MYYTRKTEANTEKQEAMKRVSELIKKLVGERSIRKTGEDSGVTASYITSILKLKYMPSAEILKKLTSASAKPRNGVSLEDLMVAAGYQEKVTEISSFQLVLDELKKKIEKQQTIIEQQRKIIDSLTK